MSVSPTSACQIKMAGILVYCLNFSLWLHLQDLNEFPLTMKTIGKSVKFALKPEFIIKQVIK